MTEEWYLSSKPKQPKHKGKYWIIDYSFYIYNGSFAYKRPCTCVSKKTWKPRKNCVTCEGTGKVYMKSSNGHVTGGLFAVFQQAVQRAQEGYKVITVFDPPKEQLVRMQLLDTYKGNRPEVPEWITFQMDYGQKVLPHTNVECYYSDTAESDDVMATLALQLANEGNYVVVASDDKDMFPLLAHKNIDLYRMRDVFTKSHFQEKFDFDPWRFNEYLAICGDAADNFNLLDGLGPKAAEFLINNTEKSVMELWKEFDKLPMKYQRKLVYCNKPKEDENGKKIPCPEKKDCRKCKFFKGDKKDDLDLSLRIATLDYKVEDYVSVNKEPDRALVEAMLQHLDMNHALQNLDDLF